MRTRHLATAERDRFVALLRDKGPDALLDTLRESPRVGNIRTPDSLGYPLHYAFETKGDKGERRIVLATDRPIGFWETVESAANDSVSVHGNSAAD